MELLQELLKLCQSSASSGSARGQEITSAVGGFRRIIELSENPVDVGPGPCSMVNAGLRAQVKVRLGFVD